MQPDESSPETLAEIVARFREVKHDINNSLGVIMALTELAEKKPESLSKLKNVVLERSPQMVSELQSVSQSLQNLAARHPEL